MTRSRFSASLAGLLAGLLATAAPAQIEQPPALPQFAAGDSTVVEGVEFFEQIVYLPVSVNGSGPFPFVLDTGAGPHSALDQEVATALGFASTLLGRGGGAGEDVVEIHRLDGASLSFGALAFAPRSVIGIPLHRMDPHWGKRKDGLVGGDLLSKLVTVIDYERGTLVLHDPAHYEHRGPGERVPIETIADHLFVRAQVLRYGAADPVEAFMMLDTGVRTSVFNAPFAREHELAAQSPASIGGITGFGLGGRSRGVVGRVRSIGIGGVTIADPVVSFSADTTGALASADFAGIIGADILSRFTVVLDYGRSYIVLAENDGFAAPFEYDMCGIRWIAEGEHFDSFKVFAIFAGSPAAEAGFLAGDLVTAVDGRPAREFSRETLGAHLRREGAVVRFTVARGAETRQVAVTLRRLV